MSQDTAGVFTDVPVESVKEYWNRRPCNIRHSQEPMGTRAYFDQVEQRKYFVEPHIPRFAEFKRWQGKKVLEIGCGIGTDTMNFARAGAQVTAVDLSEESLKVARQRAELYGLADRITFIQANAEELTRYVPMDRYDLIYSFGVIHHTPNPERAVEQIRHYAGKGTTLKVMVYNRYSWKVLWALATDGKFRFWRLDEWVARNSEAQFGSPVTYSYTPKTVKGLLAGFKVKKTWIDHVFPWRIPEYREYRYRKVWYFRWIPQPLFRLFERIFGWHLMVDAVSP